MIQVLLIEKQPPERLIPRLKEEVAVPFTVREEAVKAPFTEEEAQEVKPPERVVKPVTLTVEVA